MTKKLTADPEVDVFVQVARAEEFLARGLAGLLKQHHLSLPQYNVLRILRGAGTQGLRCQDIAGRMITRVPDITRLLDRLEAANLVSRQRSSEDGRVVLTNLRRRGHRLLANLDEPVLELHRKQLTRLNRSEMRTVAYLLRKMTGTGQS